jgi:hypothetical protein
MTADEFRRGVSRPVLVFLLAPLLVATVVFGSVNAVGAAGDKSVALSIADYALATATHERPAQVVNAADVTNAVSLTSLNTKNLELLMNLDEVYGYSRIILLFDLKSFSDTCVDFPNKVGGAPRIISCPHEAQGLLNSRPGVLVASSEAVASAAQRGQAVSGSDVVAAASKYHLVVKPKPNFAAGEGGTVKFATLVEMPPNLKFTVYICVQFPKTAYGIPTQVAC